MTVFIRLGKKITKEIQVIHSQLSGFLGRFKGCGKFRNGDAVFPGIQAMLFSGILMVGNRIPGFGAGIAKADD
ncbi:MAG: hypothetical protein ABIJ59_02485 [Pseudomonadota bacterium]